jgi:hypothetical protein
MSEYALAVTVHDPEERFPGWFGTAVESLAALYLRRVAACTATTCGVTTRLLAEAGFRVVTCPSGAAGQARRDAIRLLLAEPGVEWIQYADFDRLLHWERTYPEELRKVLQRPPSAQYIALGRTERAFQTHPRVQIMAEKLTNAAFSNTLGLPADLDLVAGSFIFSRHAAEILVARSIDPSLATDLEWPALVRQGLGAMPDYWPVEGLEFETADYYTAEIRAAGSQEAWTRQVYDTPQMWYARTKLALDSICAMQRVLG